MTLPPDLTRELVAALAEELAPRVATELASLMPVNGETSEPWRLLNVEEVATMLGRSPRSVHSFVKERGLPFVRLDGGALAFDPDDVRAWVRARRVPAADDDPLAGRWQVGRDAASGAGSGNGGRSAMQKVRASRPAA